MRARRPDRDPDRALRSRRYIEDEGRYEGSYGGLGLEERGYGRNFGHVFPPSRFRGYGEPVANFGRTFGQLNYGRYTGRGPRNYQRSDERIAEDINERLTEDGWVDATEIEVQVLNTDVTLSGTVGSRGEKRLAEDLVYTVKGVGDVLNQLRVRQGK